MIGLNYTFIYGLNNEVLKQQEFVILSRCINTVNNLCNQVCYAINGIERSIQVFILYSDWINNAPIDYMKYTSYVR